MTDTATEQERDALPGKRLAGITVGALLVAALGVLYASLMLQHPKRPMGAEKPAPSAAFGPGTPERTLFEQGARGLELEAEQRRALARYGWVDRKAGIARIPIDRAIELSAKGVSR